MKMGSKTKVSQSLLASGIDLGKRRENRRSYLNDEVLCPRKRSSKSISFQRFKYKVKKCTWTRSQTLSS
jgi:hypothetical protein